MTDVTDAPKDPDFMLSLARGLQVLEAFAKVGPDVTAAALTRETRLSRAVVDRCLHTLVKLNYVRRDGKQFTPRLQLTRLADLYLSNRSLPALVQPVLEDLRAELQESCSFGVLDGDDVVYLVRVVQPRLVAVTLQVGSRLPAWCTSMGRVLLAHQPQEAVDAYFDRLKLVARTPKSNTDSKKLRALLKTVREEGYAIVDQEIDLGLRSIAVPIHERDGTVIAALNVSGSTMHVSVEDLKVRALPRLLSAANEVTRAGLHL